MVWRGAGPLANGSGTACVVEGDWRFCVQSLPPFHGVRKGGSRLGKKGKQTR